MSCASARTDYIAKTATRPAQALWLRRRNGRPAQCTRSRSAIDGTRSMRPAGTCSVPGTCLHADTRGLPRQRTPVSSVDDTRFARPCHELALQLGRTLGERRTDAHRPATRAGRSPSEQLPDPAACAVACDCGRHDTRRNDDSPTRFLGLVVHHDRCAGGFCHAWDGARSGAACIRWSAASFLSPASGRG
jgi:hypothetical protein